MIECYRTMTFSSTLHLSTAHQ